MANVRQFYPTRREVGSVSHGQFPQRLIDVFAADGFQHELEESDDVIWRLIANNPGPRDVTVVYCKPYTYGPYQIVERMVVPSGATHHIIKEWRADNEDHFFFCEIDGPRNPIPGGNINCTWSSDANDTFMVWHHPQEFALAVRMVVPQKNEFVTSSAEPKDSTSWSGWDEIPGGGTTALPLSATVLKDKVYVFGVGPNAREHVNS